MHQHLTVLTAASAALVLAVTACSGSATADTAANASVAGSAAVVQPAATGTAADALAGLPVKGRAPKTGYSRDAFGPAWSDVDRNGCDTRNDILTRDLVERQMSTDRCTVLSGVLYPDPYTGTKIVFVRGKSLVDIDHVVALGNAWVTGAARWTPAQRLAVANDPLNLLAVQASANRQKSDADAATWLPANKAYRCAYVARQIAVKAKYGLWVTAPEKTAMQGVLTTCPGQGLPDGQFAVPVPVGPDPTPTPAPGPGPGEPRRYASCAEAKAAGVTPIVKKTNPQLYAANTHLDRDKDGVACDS